MWTFTIIPMLIIYLMRIIWNLPKNGLKNVLISQKARGDFCLTSRLIKIRADKNQSAQILQKLQKMLVGDTTQRLFGTRATYHAVQPGVHLCLPPLLMLSRQLN